MKTPNPCERVRARLDRYVDGALPSLERARDEGHLEVCVDCLAELRSLEALVASVGEALLPDADELSLAIHGVTRRLDAEPEPRFRWRYLRGRAAVSLGTAAAALLLMFGLSWVGQGLDSMTAVRSEELVPDLELSLPEWSQVVDGFMTDEGER